MNTPSSGFKKSNQNSLTKTSLTPCRRLGLSRPSPGNFKKALSLGNSPSNCDSPLLLKVSVQSEGSKQKPSITDTSIDNGRQALPLKTIELPSTSELVKVRSLHQEGKKCKLQSKNSALTRKAPNMSDTDDKLCFSNSKVDLPNIGCTPSFSKRRKLSLKVPSNCSSEGGDNGQTINHSIIPTKSCVTQEQENTPIHEESDISLEKGNEEITQETVEKLIASIKEKKKRLDELKVQENYAKKHNLEELRAQTAKWTAAGKEALRYSVDLARQSGYSVTLKELMVQHGFPQHLMGYNSEDDEFD